MAIKAERNDLLSLTSETYKIGTYNGAKILSGSMTMETISGHTRTAGYNPYTTTSAPVYVTGTGSAGMGVQVGTTYTNPATTTPSTWGAAQNITFTIKLDKMDVEEMAEMLLSQQFKEIRAMLIQMEHDLNHECDCHTCQQADHIRSLYA